MIGQETGKTTDYGQVILGNGKAQYQFALSQPVRADFVNMFAKKVSEGDPGADDHPIFTSWTQSSWVGGMGINRFNPASDTGRYWDSTCDVLYPGALMPNPQTLEYTKPGGADGSICMPLGDIGDRCYVAWGTNLYAYDPTTDGFTGPNVLPNVPVGKWSYYNDGLGAGDSKNVYIPLGLNGYATWDGVGSISAGVGGLPVQDFCTWDQKIFAITPDGRLVYAIQKPSLLTDWIFIAQIEDDVQARHILTYKDMSGESTVYVVTNRNVYALDFINKLLWITDLTFPKHPYQGKASVVHKGDMDVSVGIGVHRYDTNTISADGLDGGDGLPINMRGLIVDFDTAYNGLYALVQGAPILSDPQAQDYLIQTGVSDNQMYGPIPETQNYLALHSDYGWSQRAKFTGFHPTTVHVTDAQSDYSIFWGGGSGKLYRQVLPTMYYNPRDLANDIVPRERNAYMETPWYYWGWEGQPKIAKQLDVSVLAASANETLTVEIKYDNDANGWNTLGTINAAGEYSFRLGPNQWKSTLDDGTPYFRGVPHERVKLRFLFNNTGTDPDALMKCVKLSWFQLLCRRYLRPQMQYTVPLDLSRSEKGYTQFQQEAFLKALALDEEGVFFQVGQHQAVVDIVGMSYEISNDKMMMSLQLVESFDNGREDSDHWYTRAVKSDYEIDPNPRHGLFTGGV